MTVASNLFCIPPFARLQTVGDHFVTENVTQLSKSILVFLTLAYQVREYAVFY